METPDGMDTSDSNGAVLEVPANATLGHLKRAAARSSGGAILPSAQVSERKVVWLPGIVLKRFCGTRALPCFG